MSVKVMSWVFESSEARDATRLVALALADSAHDDGVCWPGIDRIAHKARCHPATVKRATARLIELGELTVTDRGRQTNLYQFTYCCERNMRPQSDPVVSAIGTVVSAIGTGCERNMRPPVTVREPLENRKSLSVRASAPRATQWPDNFTLTLERAEVARALRVDATAEWAKFKDHALKDGVTHKNWDAAWRYWCRRAPEFLRRKSWES